MTTERELAEWSEKIRRVRGQSPQHTARRQRQYSPLLAVVLFLAGLAIAVVMRNHHQQQKELPEIQLRPPNEYQL
jgi:uncharacterized protein HemX